MTDSEMEALAMARGMGRAWREYPADVKEAIESASKLARAFARPVDAALEPIPAYAVTRT